MQLWKLCNDVLTRIRQPGPPAAPKSTVPGTYGIGDVIPKNSVGLRIREFHVTATRNVYAHVHVIGHAGTRTSIWLGGEQDPAERLVQGDPLR